MLRIWQKNLLRAKGPHKRPVRLASRDLVAVVGAVFMVVVTATAVGATAMSKGSSRSDGQRECQDGSNLFHVSSKLRFHSLHLNGETYIVSQISIESTGVTLPSKCEFHSRVTCSLFSAEQRTSVDAACGCCTRAWSCISLRTRSLPTRMPRTTNFFHALDPP